MVHDTQLVVTAMQREVTTSRIYSREMELVVNDLHQ
jgi:hypothetical protein